MISTCVRIVMTPPTNTLTSACSSLSPSITPSVGCAAQGGGRVVVRVACEDDLHRHVGAGLIDFAAAHEFVVHAHTPMSDFREVMAGDLGFAASACCIHPCLFVHMRHLRLLPPISDVQLTQSIADLVSPLGSEEWNLLVLPRFGRGGGGGGVDGDEDLLLFLKFYDPSSQSLEYIGNLLVKPTTMLSAMGPLVNQRIGLAPREALSGYQELCGGAAGGVEGAGGAGGVLPLLQLLPSPSVKRLPSRPANGPTASRARRVRDRAPERRCQGGQRAPKSARPEGRGLPLHRERRRTGAGLFRE